MDSLPVSFRGVGKKLLLKVLLSIEWNGSHFDLPPLHAIQAKTLPVSTPPSSAEREVRPNSDGGYSYTLVLAGIHLRDSANGQWLVEKGGFLYDDQSPTWKILFRLPPLPSTSLLEEMKYSLCHLSQNLFRMF
ncbi:hypothetical protein CEXT_124051 [Caerostris extrusa]|uniref:Uncharacterized protein n=1 Tax=Caerostris extrusa TaxID=172846 RepID=A0AAV4Y2Y4_CAEEX|nr:hypothetical protein CEXT_124051 [Caerostris extrusa]